MHIGVIGIRSKHLNFFRTALARCYPGGEHIITHICGFDAPELIGNHPDLIHCHSPQQLIDAVDAVIIALREGYQHAALAVMAMEAGKPVFVDKPFTSTSEDARWIQETAQRTGVPCTGGSTICYTKEVQQLKNKLPHCTEYSLSYQADPFSPFGGWYFYGSHLTDLCTCIFGTHWAGVSACIQADTITARVSYPGFTVTLRTSPEPQDILCTAGIPQKLDDIHCYDAGMRHFCDLAEGSAGSDIPALVSSVQLLNAILTSVREGKPYPG